MRATSLFLVLSLSTALALAATGHPAPHNLAQGKRRLLRRAAAVPTLTNDVAEVADAAPTTFPAPAGLHKSYVNRAGRFAASKGSTAASGTGPAPAPVGTGAGYASNPEGVKLRVIAIIVAALAGAIALLVIAIISVIKVFNYCPTTLSNNVATPGFNPVQFPIKIGHTRSRSSSLTRVGTNEEKTNKSRWSDKMNSSPTSTSTRSTMLTPSIYTTAASEPTSPSPSTPERLSTSSASSSAPSTPTGLSPFPRYSPSDYLSPPQATPPTPSSSRLSPLPQHTSCRVPVPSFYPSSPSPSGSDAADEASPPRSPKRSSPRRPHLKGRSGSGLLYTSGIPFVESTKNPNPRLSPSPSITIDGDGGEEVPPVPSFNARTTSGEPVLLLNLEIVKESTEAEGVDGYERVSPPGSPVETLVDIPREVEERRESVAYAPREVAEPREVEERREGVAPDEDDPNPAGRRGRDGGSVPREELGPNEEDLHRLGRRGPDERRRGASVLNWSDVAGDL